MEVDGVSKPKTGRGASETRKRPAMKKERTTPAKNIVDTGKECPCTPAKLKQELRRSARKRRREERARRRENSGKKKKRSKTSSPHFDIRPEDAVVLSKKGKGLAEGEGAARLKEGAKVGVSDEDTPAEVPTVRIKDKPEEAVIIGYTSPPHKKKRKPIGTKRTKKSKPTSPHFEAEPEALPEPKRGARKVRVQKSNSTETVANTADQTALISKPRGAGPRPPKSETSGIKKAKKPKATSPHFDTRTKAPLEIITENIPQETRAKKVKKSKSTSPRFETKSERPPVTRKTRSKKSKSASPHFDIKPENASGEILMSQIDDPSKAIIDSAEQEQALIPKPRRTHSRAKVVSYIEQSKEDPEGKEKKKRRKRQSREETASVEEQERKERKKTVRRVQAGISTAIWPPLSSDRFGLIQEELKGDAFHLIVGTTFLNRTRGSVAIPLLRQFLRDYPTPHALSLAPLTKISTFLQPLGLYNIRATRLHNLATTWLTTPPIFGQAAKKYNYPPRDTKPFPSSLLPNNGVEQGRCWEIAHLPGVGAYALDSWRIFCRDEFRRAAGERVEVGQEEWRSVVPMDKELRVYVRWMWAKEGVRWKEPGDIQQTALSSPFFERVEDGKVVKVVEEGGI